MYKPVARRRAGARPVPRTAPRRSRVAARVGTKRHYTRRVLHTRASRRRNLLYLFGIASLIIGFEAMLVEPRQTGVGTAINEALVALTSIGEDEIVVFAHQRAADLLPHTPRTHYIVSRFAGLGRVSRAAWQQWPWVRNRARRSIDIYHAAGYVLPRGIKIPSVVTIYDTIALDSPQLTSFANAAYYRFAVPDSLRRATRIVVPSVYVRDRLIRLHEVNEERIVVAPLGISECFRKGNSSLSDKAVPETDDAPFALIVGNLERKKNVETILSAWREVLRLSGANVRILVVGKAGNAWGPARAILRSGGIEKYVRFMGYVSQGKLAALYKAATMLLYPSLEEGFGIPPLEAMASGTAVIASNAGALPETCGDCAILLDPLDKQAWAVTIADLFTNTTRREQLRNAGYKHAQAFTWERHAQTLLRTYREALS